MVRYYGTKLSSSRARRLNVCYTDMVRNIDTPKSDPRLGCEACI
jgi:hypothetical protein